MAAIRPIPALDVPVIGQDGLMTQGWYEFYQALTALLNATTATANAAAAATFVSSIDTATGAITLGNGLSRALQVLSASLTSTSATLGADVALNNTANYFDGPSVSLANPGTWFVVGTVLVSATTIPTETVSKLWDGTTVISSTSMENVNATRPNPATLSGIITNPAGNVRISCRNPNSTDGKIYFNQSGNSKDSHITAVRIA